MTARRSAEPRGAGDRLSVLLLADDSRDHADALLEHIGAFRAYSRHRVRTFNPRGLRSVGALDLDEFDVVVVHYSLVITLDSYLPVDLREKIRRFEGLKIQFIQDDYRWVDELAAMMRYLGIDVLFTLVPERELGNVWGERIPETETITTLAGYVSESLPHLRPAPLDRRALDVGYRGRTLPFWLGRLGQEKILVARGFLERAPAYGLRCDIAWSESDRIYGRDWIDFIASCRATLGTESGASITDFDGSIERRVLDYVRERPGAEFEEVFREILAPFEGNVLMNVVSPRIFEAAALRTALILFPGEYSGTIEPNEHYVALEKDFSNMDEVVARLRDTRALEEMTERAHADLVASGRYSYRTMVATFDDVLERAESRAGTRRPTRYLRARTQRFVARPRTSWLPGKRSALDPRTVRGAYASGRLILPVPELRSLLFAHLLNGPARRAIRIRDVIADLVRLALVRQAQLARLTAGEIFHVTAEKEPESGRLLLTSRPGVGTQDLSALWPVELSRAVVWNHVRLGRSVPWRLRRSRWLVAELGDAGVHRFEVLAALALRFPDRVSAAVRASVDAQPRQLGRLERLVRHWRPYVAFVLLMLRHLLARDSLRWVARGYLGDRRSRRAVNARGLLRDVLRASMLFESVRLGRFRILAKHDAADGTLLLRSVPVADGDASERHEPLTARPIDRVVWDHSAVGVSIVSPVPRRRPVPIPLGSGGRYEFTALAAIAARHPDEATAAFGRLARNGNGP